jgi:hypothetical protein
MMQLLDMLELASKEQMLHTEQALVEVADNHYANESRRRAAHCLSMMLWRLRTQ